MRWWRGGGEAIGVLGVKRMCAVSAGWEGVCVFQCLWVERKDTIGDIAI